MSQQQHIIGRTVLELDIEYLDEVWSFQEEISELLQQQAIPAMERLFDQLVGADQVIRLDQVVVELEPVDRRWLADEFVGNLLEALSQTLSDRLAEQLPIAADAGTIRRDRPLGGAKGNRAGADWEILLYFLQYGRLPWWSLTEDWQSWIPRWEAVMQEGTRWQAPLRALLTTDQAARKRLVAQFPEGFRHQVVLQLQPTWTTWRRLLLQAQRLMQTLNLSSSTYRQLEQQAWVLLFAEIPPDLSPNQPLPTARWIRTWLAQVVQIWQAESLTEAGQALRPDGTDASAQRQSPPRATKDNGVKVGRQPDTGDGKQAPLQVIIHQRLHTLIESIPNVEISLWLAALDQVIPCPPTTQTPASTASQSTPDSSSQANDIDATDQTPDIFPEAISEDLEGAMRILELPELAISGDISRQVSNSHLSPEEEAAGLFINHSGLVILHPFLRLYFEDVGLLDGEAFRDESAQQTAIYLLHYLATGQTDAPEYELVLPKLLCGWPLNQPVAAGVELPDAALTEGEHLLQTVIDYWKVLKSTSPDGLREGFLQREGKLTRQYEGDWKLQVEQKAIDVLLSSLPWGLSIVNLPWMESMLMVEWS